MKANSFFDDEAQKLQKKIWDKVPQNRTFHTLENVYLFNTFYKKSTKPGKAKQLHYILTQDGLY